MFFEQSLRKKLEAYYNLEDNFSIAGKRFNFLARYNQRNSKYILKKDMELYAFEYNEYIFFKKLENTFTQENFNEVKSLISEHYDQVIDLNENHMASSIIFLFETELPDNQKLIKSIEKFKFYKSFKFGLKGWLNGGILLIDPKANMGLSNKYAKKDLKKFLA
ncbi:hypothetical protein [Paramaledivibacter caminithermalis]|jgi:hypothetical protein|uniref:DUF8052 domain-containing protein n=1 Tax=Paramaledivibacter caminithermalis (strain DSM 15212 / CIP 107654 / DViRD3) TaxID=1121301 RepID=A0A1M6MI25_PARC5|nr:hypothetical protein [Paramaledivibacter caminithermalis]SHJ83056.1 hypothetical protein SAMN02745912_01266 [Paramaledivibacter caminithermalis DSM 15212]